MTAQQPQHPSMPICPIAFGKTKPEKACVNCMDNERCQSRSRPPPSPDIIFTQHEIKQILLRLNAPFTEEAIKEMVEITRKHDATIRNQTLDEIAAWAEDYFDNGYDSLGIELEAFRNKIESLRTEAPQ